ncbi:MAG: RrF2 family transcriptional regulator [Vulcanococcus sp.]|uniref:RrF2 family transcriptional regulator n=1 Tax=Vulcanococcus sp. TaxID=2856995 RepID=UPI003C011C9C
MLFSAKTTYALLALIELADVQASGEKLQVAQIANRQDIPERYLEQMMGSLRKAGLLRSVRGPKGGYQLARPAAAISLAEVVALLEPTNAASHRRQSTPEQQVLQQVSQALQQQHEQQLLAISLATLLRQRNELQLAQAMYFI